jgi:RecJ-like exonuclease
MTAESVCETCNGTGDVPSRVGPAACPDCGGSGKLPAKHVLLDWRSADIERALSAGITVHPKDVQFLLTELRSARKALTEIVALAHDIDDPNQIAVRIRMTATDVLGLLETRPDSKAS